MKFYQFIRQKKVGFLKPNQSEVSHGLILSRSWHTILTYEIQIPVCDMVKIIGYSHLCRSGDVTR